MGKIICRLVGIVFLLLGVVLGVMPIPIGWVMILLGLMFIIPTTPSVAKLIRKIRKHFSFIDNLFHRVTRRAPMPYKRVLRETEHDEFKY